MDRKLAAAALPVKIRLERPAGRSKREIEKIFRCYAQNEVEGIES